MSQFEAMFNEPPFHFYPGRQPYRRSRAVRAQVGDVALCGYVKSVPPGMPASPVVTCEMCSRLRDLGL
jgi:hypothetical protein